MASNTSLLSELLKKWANSDTKNSDLALEILVCAQTSIITYLQEDKSDWFEFLLQTRKSRFLKSLPDEKDRITWSEIVFLVIQKTQFSLLNLFEQRVGEHPKKVLFRDMSTSNPGEWSYEQVFRQLKEIAAVFYQLTNYSPRVAIFCDNSIDSACCDIACLCFDIFDTPLNIHFSKEILLYIIQQLNINIVVVDNKERFKKIEEIKNELLPHLIIVSVTPIRESQTLFLGEQCKQLSNQEMMQILSLRKIRPIEQVATTMFTSGSTGQPKGVSFSNYNLVSKRFARAAAVPKVGEDEVFLCFLPLFHTFGRFLEMLGSIYWSSTYVFAGNPSAETLLTLFPKVNPSVFISIPLRWLNLYERCIELSAMQTNQELKDTIFRQVVGSRLKWGLSAAGYLDPKVFLYFQNNGVELCSGFGMTEATGGITMTLPGAYKQNSVGMPLPGVRTRLRENNELELRGHYIARYLEDAGPNDIIPFPHSDDTDHWMGTGDIFNIANDGHHEIIDRVKDIYKNNKGQTVAPQVIEKKFTGVPGIKRTFLVGDGKPYNVLLIVPDFQDSFVNEMSEENRHEYFHQIVMAANKEIAPYERGVNFAILERDFSVELDELTPKGTFNRKAIEKNFQSLIASLYTSNTISLNWNDFNISIPRWFFRDLGILENDITIVENQLINRRTKQCLSLELINENQFLIGDLEYIINGKTIDLGIFARQPKLWICNPELISFSPVKDGWDFPLGDISERVFFPRVGRKRATLTNFPAIKGLNDQKLIFINNLLCTALFSEQEIATSAINQLGDLFTEFDPRVGTAMRRRLEALACHPVEKRRILAYRTLLLDETNPDYSKSFPAFVQSGLSFLNEDSIIEIASKNLGKKQLEAFRLRLYAYRVQMSWPVDQITRKSFEDILKLLYKFATSHLEFFTSVRAELAAWVLHKSDPELAKVAEFYFNELNLFFAKDLNKKTLEHGEAFWNSRLIFEGNISDSEAERMKNIFIESLFVKQSVILAFNEIDFTLDEISENGIWISRLQSYKDYRHYRMSINSDLGKHYDLHLVLSTNPDEVHNPESVHWIASIAGYAFGMPTVPNLGCSFPEMGVLSTQYIGGLSVWDKIREYSEIHKSVGQLTQPNLWRKLFIKAFTTFFKAWHNSGFQIIPGSIGANNVVVPELDFRENATIVSLTGWKKYDQPLSLITPMVIDFYNKTVALYPTSKKELNLRWIFDACIEALGTEKAIDFLEKLLPEVQQKSQLGFGTTSLSHELSDYLNYINHSYYLPLAVYNAIDRYTEWLIINPISSSEAKELTIFELFELYKLQNYPAIVRYYLYRNTYFAEKGADINDVFDILLAKMNENVKISPVQLIELSNLQAVISEPDDKRVFSKMVFPKIQNEQRVDLMKIGDNTNEQIIVRSLLTDKKKVTYTFREPLNANEVGQLYQLFYKENYPKVITKQDKHLVITDAQDIVLGGLCYKMLESNTVLLDGTVITSPLQGNGLGSEMIEDFFTRMSNQGIKLIKAHFLFGNYYLKHNFKVDKKWGALVKYL